MCEVKYEVKYVICLDINEQVNPGSKNMATKCLVILEALLRALLHMCIHQALVTLFHMCPYQLTLGALVFVTVLELNYVINPQHACARGLQ